MLAFLATATTVFVACGDDDDGSGKTNSGQNITGRWTEQGNKLIYSQSYDQGGGVSYTMTWTLTFNNNVCVDSRCVYNMSTNSLAQAIYQAYANDPTVTISGNTVTFDFTSEHAGLTKNEAMALVEQMGGLM